VKLFSSLLHCVSVRNDSHVVGRQQTWAGTGNFSRVNDQNRVSALSFQNRARYTDHFMAEKGWQRK